MAVCLALATAPAAADGPATPPPSAEGPGGRTSLGSWTLSLDPASRGIGLGWQRGGFAGSTVSVPNVVGADQFKGPAGTRNYQGSVAWYRTTFQAPLPGAYALAFTSANFHANVWLDGSPIASHTGPYLSFEGRAQLAAGTHTVVLRVDWRDPGAQSGAGFHRTWFNWGGLDGAVSVRPIGASELIDPTIQTTLAPGAPNAQAATVRLGVQVHNNGPARQIAAQGTLSLGTQTVAISFPAQTIAHGQTAGETATVAVANPQLWSPSHPALYNLSLAIGQESSFSARVGLRQLAWHAGRLYLNGKRLRLHGASLQEDALGHGDALTGSDADTLVAELKAIGANAVRSQHPLDAALLERLDGAGILVWQGIGPVEGAANWHETTPALLRSAEQQARAAVLAAQLHPSIFAWNVVNEVAKNGRDASEVSYVRSTTRWLHANDPTRMVAVDVWGDDPPTRAGALYREVDAVAETDYTGWYDSPRDTPAQQVALMRSRLSAMHRTFAGKVLVISEFGAESNALNAPGQPGSYSFQASLLARHIAVYAADPGLSGMLIWLLRDYPVIPAFQGGAIHSSLPRLRLIEGINQKGLFTYAGAAKPAAGVIARLFRTLPSE
ncbi:MAG: glycoside hydrolase family 2 TIM barrel-domain containing protein [Solirubrobacterales bacterium]